MANLRNIEGIGEDHAQKLSDVGVSTTDALLEKGATPQGRQDLAEKTGISPQLILEWVNHADLFRIDGVGEEYADLLEAVGVDTVPELAQRNPVHLRQAIVELNEEQHLVRQLPSPARVDGWVRQAKKLPRKITY
jgi:predicted flap endonuclease-1-like 5' DNA nuclease